jgi:hypothetical protein
MDDQYPVRSFIPSGARESKYHFDFAGLFCQIVPPAKLGTPRTNEGCALAALEAAFGH